MKSELKEIKPNQTPHQFPALYKKDGVSLVVMFTSSTKGTVIVGGFGWDVGVTRDNWNEAESEHWQRLPSGSQVILTQD